MLYTSHQAAHPNSAFMPARDHAAVEAHLEALDEPFTSLRNGYYTSSLQHHIGNAAQTGELAAPADGQVSWTARVDLAEAAAIILARQATFEEPTPPLTASDTMSLDNVAEALSELSGHKVRRVVTDDEQFVSSMTDKGTPEEFARMFLGSYQASRNGEFAVTDPTLSELLGREPQSVRSVLSGES